MHDIETVRKVSQEVVNGREGYVYSGSRASSMDCVYTDSDGAPSCLVGHVLVRLGIPDEVLFELDASTDAAIGTTAHPGIVQKFSHQALTYMSIAQNNQDTGHTWGDSLNQAEMYYRTLAD